MTWVDKEGGQFSVSPRKSEENNMTERVFEQASYSAYR